MRTAVHKAAQSSASINSQHSLLTHRSYFSTADGADDRTVAHRYAAEGSKMGCSGRMNQKPAAPPHSVYRKPSGRAPGRRTVVCLLWIRVAETPKITPSRVTASGAASARNRPGLSPLLAACGEGPSAQRSYHASLVDRLWDCVIAHGWRVWKAVVVARFRLSAVDERGPKLPCRTTHPTAWRKACLRGGAREDALSRRVMCWPGVWP
jgi:hypothetical protein